MWFRTDHARGAIRRHFSFTITEEGFISPYNHAEYVLGLGQANDRFKRDLMKHHGWDKSSE